MNNGRGGNQPLPPVKAPGLQWPASGFAVAVDGVSAISAAAAVRKQRGEGQQPYDAVAATPAAAAAVAAAVGVEEDKRSRQPTDSLPVPASRAAAVWAA